MNLNHCKFGRNDELIVKEHAPAKTRHVTLKLVWFMDCIYILLSSKKTESERVISENIKVGVSFGICIFEAYT
jgi:hypothetical protein